ncbi:hypothetical protein H4582DRAFT_1206566 [Lactarius indigo]|nr:hypothetical protein H4582DRAFT_1206566 [Lactarius indigo]
MFDWCAQFITIAAGEEEASSQERLAYKLSHVRVNTSTVCVLSRTPFHLCMTYYAEQSAQCVAWKKIKDLGNTEAFTTGTLGLAAQYEALRVWVEYVKQHGNLEPERAKQLVQVVADAWITLQVAYRIDPHAAEAQGTAAIAGASSSSVNLKLAQEQAKRGALITLAHILEFDIAKLLYHYNRFLTYTPG